MSLSVGWVSWDTVNYNSNSQAKLFVLKWKFYLCSGGEDVATLTHQAKTIYCFRLDITAFDEFLIVRNVSTIRGQQVGRNDLDALS